MNTGYNSDMRLKNNESKLFNVTSFSFIIQ